MNQQVNPVVKAENLIVSLKSSFNEMAETHKAVNFESECKYALGLIGKNKYLMQTFMANPESLKAAVLNVAGAGISLNPVHAHAYLVPRDGMVCLDVSYKGMCYLGIEGGLEWVQASLVYEQDTFHMNAIGELPVHQHNPFSKERGAVIGAYCVAKLHTGEYLTTAMSADEINHIKKRSKAQNGPWKTDWGEMAKKTVIKRAAKLWPNKKMDRLKQVIEVVNEHEGIDFEAEQKQIEKREEAERVDYEKRDELIGVIREGLSRITKGWTIQRKGEFLLEQFEVATFDHLKKKTVQDLEICIKKLEVCEKLMDNKEVDIEVQSKSIEEKKAPKCAREASFRLEGE